MCAKAAKPFDFSILDPLGQSERAGELQSVVESIVQSTDSYYIIPTPSKILTSTNPCLLSGSITDILETPRHL